jgi:NAD(P)-dependent dehydrogenase (short-subunit alcohol dehydrogenase family)
LGKILDGKIVLITGGGSGIGRAAAVLFANEGAKVIIAGRRIENGNETVEMIQKTGGEAIFIQTDISIEDQIEKLISDIVQKYGRLDCAFNNGGVDGKPAPIVDCEEEDWDMIIDINLKGTFLLMKYEIRQMLIQGYGSIVNMSSVCGTIARPNRCAYNASRHGVEGLTKTAALEYSNKGIRINAVAPGSIRTDIFYRSTQGNPEKEKIYAQAHPIGRIGEPEEVATAALWLCSDAASFVTGSIILVDGGLTKQ